MWDLSNKGVIQFINSGEFQNIFVKVLKSRQFGLRKRIKNFMNLVSGKKDLCMQFVFMRNQVDLCYVK